MGAALPLDPSADVLVVGGGAAWGWRAWTLRYDSRIGFALGPVFHRGALWSPGVPTAAVCGGSSDAHAAPDPACGCGLHAAKGPELLPTVRDAPVAVVGTVDLWGRVIEHERGYRAALAYPRSLRLVCFRCGRAGDAARMVVGPARRGDVLVAACRRHLRRPRRGVLPGQVVLSGLLRAYGLHPLPDPLARRIPPWRRVVVHRLLVSGVGRAVAVAYGLLAVVMLLAAAAVLTGRLPGAVG